MAKAKHLPVIETTAAETTARQTAMIEVPVGPEIPDATWGIHVDTRLTPTQASILRRITQQLDRQQATLASGKRIVSPTDALKYLLEALGRAAIS